MTEILSSNGTSQKNKLDIFIILAYILFLYIAFIYLFDFLRITIRLFTDGISVFTQLFTDDYVLFDTILFAFYPAAIIIFFRIAVLSKPANKPVKIYVWLFIMLNLIRIMLNIDVIFANPLSGLSWYIFSLYVGVCIINIILSISFLKFGRENSKLSQILTNKWFILSLLLVMFIYLSFNTFKEIFNYMRYINSMNNFSILFETSYSIDINFPTMSVLSFISFAFSMLIFFTSIMTNKSINKYIFIVILLTAVLIAVSLIVDIIEVTSEPIENVLYRSGGFFYPDFYSIAGVILLLSMYRICNRNAVCNLENMK